MAGWIPWLVSKGKDYIERQRGEEWGTARYTVHETVSPCITPCPSTAAVAQITTVVVDHDTDDGRGGGKSLAIAELGLMQGHLIKDVLWQEGSDCPGAVTDCVSSFKPTNT